MENVILIGAITPEQDDFQLSEYIEELEFLTQTAGGNVVKIFKQKVNDERIATELFLERLSSISKIAKKEGVELLVENNVLTIKVVENPIINKVEFN